MTHRGHGVAEQVFEDGIAQEDRFAEGDDNAIVHYQVLRSMSGARREWDYVGGYTADNVAIVPKQYLAGFRLAGGRVAELRQGFHALNRWEALQKKDLFYFASEKVLEHYRATKQAGARIAALESENEKLRVDAEILRKLVSRDRAGSESNQPPPTPSVLTKASEFLVVLPVEYRAFAVSLLETGQLPAGDLVRELGPEAALHFASLLGWAELGYVSGSALVATRLGTALGESLKAATKTADVPLKPSPLR